MLELLSHTPAPGEAGATSSGVATASANTLLSLINDVLDFSKIEAGKLEVERIPFDLSLLFEDVAEMFGHRAAEKGLELTCFVRPELPRRVSVTRNVCGRSSSTSRGTRSSSRARGGVRIEVRPIPGGDEVEVSVTDTGIGISAEQQALLFRPFSQVDASTTRHFGGTGLGLAICRKIVHRYGGRIGVESERGAGAKFWFTLPFRHPSRRAIAALDPGAAAYDLTDQAVNRPILVVEDDQNSAELFQELLTLLGYQLDFVPDGQQCLAQSAALDYDLIIVDCLLPELDGYATTRLIREREIREQQPRVPIIGVTAQGMPGEREHCLAAGMDDYLAKPIEFTLFAAAVARWLDPTSD
ncbi:MAG: response regulator [Spirulinaceae cyanobacterium RM2_2_10]|nr:response regulator [Spirulinaceae cyanobacterium RM2_2_10]